MPKTTEREMFKSRFVLFCSTLLFQPLCDRLATMTSRMKKKRKIFNTTGTDGSFVVLLFTTCFKHMSFHTPIPTGLFWGFFPLFFLRSVKTEIILFQAHHKVFRRGPRKYDEFRGLGGVGEEGKIDSPTPSYIPLAKIFHFESFF